MKSRIQQAENMIDKIFVYLSGEFLLSRTSNSGFIVFIRSVLVALILYAIAVAMKSYTREEAILSFSSSQLRKEIAETIPWFGAVFAGAYASFYARFSSQWNYLASLYNQIMSTRCSMTETQLGSCQDLIHWEAGFIEDAMDLHLACKPMFFPMVKMLLEDERVKGVFLESATDAQVKIERLQLMCGGKINAGIAPKS
jgi:hypothetical protein